MDLYSKLFIYIHTPPTCIQIHTCILKHIYFKVNWSQSLLQQVLSKLIFGRNRSTAMWYIWFVIKLVRQHRQVKPTDICNRKMVCPGSMFCPGSCSHHTSTQLCQNTAQCQQGRLADPSKTTPLNLSRCSKTSKYRLRHVKKGICKLNHN